MTMEEVAKDENLRLAFAQVKKNRGSHGVDGRGVEDVERHLSEAKYLKKYREAFLKEATLR